MTIVRKKGNIVYPTTTWENILNKPSNLPNDSTSTSGFNATINSTTFQDIKTKCDAGQVVIATETDGNLDKNVYNLTYLCDDYALFSRIDGNTVYFQTVNSNGWTASSTSLTPSSNITALSQLTDDSTHRLVTDTEKSTWSGKQDALQSGINLKTINNQSLLGSGNIQISGSSSTEDCVKTVQQNLTSEQQIQARTNIGAYTKPISGIPASDLASGVIPGPEIFVAEYGVSTFAEVKAAYDAGKYIVVSRPYIDSVNDLYILYSTDGNDTFQFCRFESETDTSWFIELVSSGWSNIVEHRLQRFAIRSSFQSTPDDSHYPSEKLVKDSLDTKQQSYIGEWSDELDGPGYWDLVTGAIPRREGDTLYVPAKIVEGNINSLPSDALIKYTLSGVPLPTIGTGTDYTSYGKAIVKKMLPSSGAQIMFKVLATIFVKTIDGYPTLRWVRGEDITGQDYALPIENHAGYFVDYNGVVSSITDVSESGEASIVDCIKREAVLPETTFVAKGSQYSSDGPITYSWERNNSTIINIPDSYGRRDIVTIPYSSGSDDVDYILKSIGVYKTVDKNLIGSAYGDLAIVKEDGLYFNGELLSKFAKSVAVESGSGLNSAQQVNSGADASGEAAFAEGDGVASGDFSHAEGYGTESYEDYSHAEGLNTTADGVASHAEGDGTQAIGQNSHAEGWNTIASNANAHAEGRDTTASNNASHAEGRATTASEQNAHAEGYQTTASGANAHAEGYLTTASGHSAHAEGRQTVASTNYSHAGGRGTQASHNECEHAEGKWNLSNTDTLYSIGVGTTTNDRKNAIEVTTTGFTYALGIGGYNGTNPGNSESLAEVINSKQSLIDSTHKLDYSLLSNTPLPEVFIATYDETPWLSISNAYQQGKLIVCKELLSPTNPAFYALQYIDTDPMGGLAVFYSHGNDGQTYTVVSIDRTFGWSKNDFDIEMCDNKVTSWNSTPDDAYYPSEKLVKNYIDNHVTSIESDINTLETEVESIDIGCYIEAWDGASSPVVADIPYGVSVTYNSTSYTGELVASAATLQKIYLVSDTNGNYDRYITVESNNTYSWIPIGSTAISLSDYATITSLEQLNKKLSGYLDLSLRTVLTSSGTTSDNYITPSGNIVPAVGFSVNAYTINGGSYLIDNVEVGNSNSCAWTAKANGTVVAYGGNDLTDDHCIAVCPDNADTLYVCHLSTDIANVTVTPVVGRLETINSELSDLQETKNVVDEVKSYLDLSFGNLLVPTATEAGKHITPSGNIQTDSDNYFSIRTYDAVEGQIYKLSGLETGNVWSCAWAAYSGQDKIAYGGNNLSNDELYITFPHGADTLYLYNITTDIANLSVQEVNGIIGNLSDRVAILEASQEKASIDNIDIANYALLIEETYVDKVWSGGTLVDDSIQQRNATSLVPIDKTKLIAPGTTGYTDVLFFDANQNYISTANAYIDEPILPTSIPVNAEYMAFNYYRSSMAAEDGVFYVSSRPYYKRLTYKLYAHTNKQKNTRPKVYIYTSDSQETIFKKLVDAIYIEDCDVIFEHGAYTFDSIFYLLRSKYNWGDAFELPLGGNCHYYFNNSTLIGSYGSETPSTNLLVEQNSSVLGTHRLDGQNYELYDGEIIANGMVYCIHDEANGGPESYVHKYFNMIVDYNTGTYTQNISKCIGGGTGLAGEVVIDGCVFYNENTAESISWHGHSETNTTKFKVFVKNSYLEKAFGCHTLASNETATLLLTSCSIPSVPSGTRWTVLTAGNDVRS